MDWKEALSQINLPDGDLPADETAGTVAEECEGNASAREKLTIFYEKKGRGGKKATIIAGFQCDDEELAEVAARLKKKLGVGGSARGGEILIQGDARAKACAILREMGYRVGGSVGS